MSTINILNILTSHMMTDPKVELERLESVLDSAKLGIWDWNPQTNAVVFNKRWKEMVGYQIDELKDELASWEMLIHPDDKEHTYKTLQDHMAGKNSYYESIHRLKHKDGHWIWILDTGRIVERDSQNRPIRATGIHQDITKEMNLKDSLKKEKIAAIKANQVKSMFLANMSHEIRTPMNGIKGAVQLLQGTQLDNKQVELVDMISTSTDYLLTIINDILDMSKIEAGKLMFDNEKFYMQPVLNHIYNMFQDCATRKGIQLDVSQSRFSVIGDKTRVTQIIINIVGNAIKFTHIGRVSLKITKEDPGLCIKVSDTGIGMTAEDKEKLFKPFTQADLSITKKYGGTGLGTTITKHLVDMMNGTIDVVSEFGKGTTFTIKLPLEVATVNITDVVETAIPHRDYQNTVILAEDNIINVKIAHKILNKLGVKVIIANNGQELIDSVGLEHELILTDCCMPILDGETATIKLREAGYSKPIIAMTANVFAEDRIRYREIGMDDIVCKPFTIADIVRVLDKYLG